MKRVKVTGDLYHGLVPEGAVYVGRAAPGLAGSPYANPFSVTVAPCGRCNGTGWEITPDGGNGRAARCPCALDRPIGERLAGAGVPSEFWDPAHPDYRELQGERHPDLGLFPLRLHLVTFTGATGTGKSREAAEFVRARLLAGGRARWWEAEELVDAIKARFDREPGPEAVVEPLLSPGVLLVLDDCWTQQETAFNEAMISRIIRRRYRDAAPTIITTNLPEEAVALAEPKLHSRMWGSLVIPTGGRDWRRETR